MKQFLKANKVYIIVFLTGFLLATSVLMYKRYKADQLYKQNRLSEIKIDSVVLKYKAVNDSVLMSEVFNRKKAYKLISLLDASCADCINELENWKVFIEEVDKAKVNIVFIGYNTTYEMLEYNIKLATKFSEFTFYDKDAHFMKLNNLTISSLHKTFLLDEDNNVVAWGNPIKDVRLVRDYMEFIQKPD